LGIRDGNKVRASSIRGSIEVKIRVSERMEQGTIFMPFHFPESETNALTIDALDPIAKTPEYKVCAICIEKIPQEAKEAVIE
jgi:formate dehydrogenase major subunit